ncbi:MAG TPA: DUF881 domain-containing protein [Catenuloplanes sp.]
MEYTTGAASWRLVLRRAAAGFWSGRSGGRRTGWSPGVPLIALAAGLLFTTTAATAGGTALREDRRPEFAQVIEQRRQNVEAREGRAAVLRAEVEAQTDALAGSDVSVQEQRQRADGYRSGAGFTAMQGPGLTVELDDAPALTNGNRRGNPSNDDLVVHQGDVQAVVNALWAGGAEAMSIMNVRVISTSAVRCVGNTLLLHGRFYSPPFKVVAIGDPTALQRSLTEARGVQLFRAAVADFGLGYRETVEGNVRVPAYDGSSGLRNAQVSERPR